MRSPLAIHLALWIPFVFLVVLAWFTVVVPELATERPEPASSVSATP